MAELLPRVDILSPAQQRLWPKLKPAGLLRLHIDTSRLL